MLADFKLVAFLTKIIIMPAFYIKVEVLIYFGVSRVEIIAVVRQTIYVMLIIMMLAVFMLILFSRLMNLPRLLCLTIWLWYVFFS